jgi:hypothetical protein
MDRMEMVRSKDRRHRYNVQDQQSPFHEHLISDDLLLSGGHFQGMWCVV